MGYFLATIILLVYVYFKKSPRTIEDGINYVILNNRTSNLTGSIDPKILSGDIENLMKNLKQHKYMDDYSIDYFKLIKSDLYKNEYKDIRERLRVADLNKLLDPDDQADNDKNILAFFLNVYNIISINSLAHLYSLDMIPMVNASLLAVLNGKFWAKSAYIIGFNNNAYSLDDIEHGIIRGNRVHPSTNQHKFDNNDPRAKFSLHKIDPRIHFALNCGAKGCPPINFYSRENLDAELNNATRNFVTATTRINENERTVELTKLFLWYREDFVNHLGRFDTLNNIKKAVDFLVITRNYESIKWMTAVEKDNKILLEYVLKYLDPRSEKNGMLKNLLESEGAIRISYAMYDFGVNRNDHIN